MQTYHKPFNTFSFEHVFYNCFSSLVSFSSTSRSPAYYLSYTCLIQWLVRTSLWSY